MIYDTTGTDRYTEIKLAVYRDRALSLELYGYHVLLRRWWERDGRGYGPHRVVFEGDGLVDCSPAGGPRCLRPAVDYVGSRR